MASPSLPPPEDALLAEPAPEPAPEAALVARAPDALVGAGWPAVLPRRPLQLPGAAVPPGGADDVRPQPPPRGRSRLESLLEIILQEQREQTERIARLQEGIDDLNSRLRPPERVPTLPVAELIAPAPVAAAAALADAAPARPPSLVEIATEVALLNALSEVLARHHEAAQERASAAATRLQRAEAHAASLDAADIDPLPLAAPEEEAMLALEYPTTPDDDALAARQLVPASASPPADASVLGGASAMLRRYRDARAEARDAAARDAALVARSRELLALTATAHDDGDEQRSPRSPMPRPASPRDHTPASSGAMVLRSSAPRGGDVAAAAARTASGEALRNLLDFALSDADFGRVLSLLAAAGGHSGPAPASPDAIRAVPELGAGGADAAELDARECPVCLAELGAGGAVKAMPCGSRRVPHAFHAACIERWLGMHNSCPTCRTALAEPPRATTPDTAL